MAERVIQTMRRKLARYIVYDSRADFVTVWPKLVDSYNKTWHSAIKMAPADVTMDNQSQVFMTLFGASTKKKLKLPDLKVGQHVRIGKNRLHFEKKSQTEAWTPEVFVIESAVKSDPNYYCLRDLKGEEIVGAFYRQEILPVNIEMQQNDVEKPKI